MTYAQGISFRATLAYVSDGATDSFEAGGASATYPRTTAQGNIVGWEQPIGNTRDRSATVDHRLAGIHYTVNSQEDFRFDLPAAGTYNIRIAAGDISSVNNTVWSVVDGTTVLGSLTTGTNGASGSFRDATNTQLTAAAWLGSNTAVAFTFSSTICRIRSSSTAAADVIAYVYVEAATPAGNTVSPSGASVTLTGNAPTITQPYTVSPGGASLTITGNAPTVTQPRTVSPAGASLAITGNAPSVTQATARTISPSGAVLTLTGNAPQVTQNPGGYPNVYASTIMRQSTINEQGGTLHDSLSISAGTMAGTAAKSAIMRAQATSRVAAMTNAPINRTVALL